MKTQNLKKNLFFQLSYQAVILIIPLIISPYLTRVLGSTQLGVYSYVNSIAYYFLIFANLGISTYGQRIISQNRNDKDSLRKAFWSLSITHVVVSSIAIIFYSFFVLFFAREDLTIYQIHILFILSALFDFTWLFYGVENVAKVVAANALVKLSTLIFIFIFVKAASDLWIYTLIECMAILIANIILIPGLIKEYPPTRVSVRECFVHVKPMIILFIAVVASTLYTVFDKTLLGMLTTKDNVAFYEYSNKIIAIPRSFIIAIGTVFFPRACMYAKEGDVEKQKKYANYALLIIVLIAIGSIFGLISIGKPLVNIYYGDEFAICGPIIIALSPLLLIIGIGDVIRKIYLIPMNRDKLFVFSICLNALVNIVLSIALIPFLGVYGAVIGTLGAELCGLLFQSIWCRKQISFSFLLKTILIATINGCVMMLFIRLSSFYLGDTIKGLIIKVIIGIVIYGALTLASIKLFYRDIWTLVVAFFEKISLRRFPFYDSRPVVLSSETNKKKRDLAIDVCRVIGLLLIILAHTSIHNNGSSLLLIIRRFDVVLLVFASGLSFQKSATIFRNYSDYFKYLIKRIKRLLIPGVFFVLLYYLFSLGMNFLIPFPYLDIKSFLLSITMIGGFGYVWIIRVLFCVAVIAPFISNFSKLIKSKYVELVFITIIFIVNCVSVYFSKNLGGSTGLLVNEILLPVIGYSVVYWLAIMYHKFSNIDKFVLLMSLIGLTILFGFLFGWNAQAFKFPPTLIYISYGLMCSIFIYELFSRIMRNKDNGSKVLRFLSTNSFTLYFAHVFILYPFSYSGVLEEYWWAQYLILIFGSAILATIWLEAKKAFYKIIMRKRIEI